MNFDPKTRVAVVTGPGPQITGTVMANDRDGRIEVLLDSGETALGNDGDFYELTDTFGCPMIDSEPNARREPVGVPQFARDRDPSFAGFHTWGPTLLIAVHEDGGTR